MPYPQKGRYSSRDFSQTMNRIAFLSCIFLILIIPISIYPDVLIKPALILDSGANSTTYMASRNITSGIPSRTEFSIVLASYLNPDIYLEGTYLYSCLVQKGNSFQRSNNLEIYGEYLLAPEMKAGISFASGLNKDSLYSQHDYLQMSMDPTLYYQLGPYSALALSFNYKNTFYDSNESLISNEYYGTFTWQLFPWLMGAVGTKLINNTSRTESYASKGHGYNVTAVFYPSNELSFTSKIDLEFLDYPSPRRHDEISVQSYQIDYSFWHNFMLKAGYIFSVDNSTDDDNRYANKVSFLGVSYSLPIGNQFPNKNSSYVSYLLSEAQTCINKDQYASARKYLHRILLSNGKNSETLFWLGFSYHKEKEYAKAIDCFNEVLKEDSTYIEAYYLLGHSYIKAKQPVQAKKILATLYKITKDKTVQEILKSL